jgi:hypothetical protein
VGDKGLILGGEAYAVQGIRAGGIGKKSGRTTHVHCGIDFTAQQEKEKYNNELHILSAKLARLHEILADPDEPSGEKRTKLEELQRRLEEEQRQAGAKVAELLGHINVDETAVIEVPGEIAAGTLIEICQIALFVSEPLKKVRIKLDLPGGRLMTEDM